MPLSGLPCRPLISGFGLSQHNGKYVWGVLELFDAELLHNDLVATLHAVLSYLPRVVEVAEVVRTLLSTTSRGPALVVAIAANLPDRLAEVLDELAIGCEPDQEWLATARQSALLELCRLAPHHAAAARELLVERTTFPGLAVKLTLEVCGDVVPFLSSLLPNKRHWGWMAAAFRQDWAGPAPKLFPQLAAALADVPGSDIPGAAASARARIYCAMFCTAEDQPAATGAGSAVESIMAFFTREHPPSPAAARLVELALCAFAACPALNPSIDDSPTNQVKAWLELILARAPLFGFGAGEGYANMLLLMAAHFHSGNIKAVANLVRSKLGFHQDLPIEGIRRLSTLFLEVFPPATVAPMMISIAVTPNLHAGVPGFLPIHCVLHELQSRSFVMLKVQPARWILKQLQAAAVDKPVHPLLPPLVRSLADFATEPFGTALSGITNVPRLEDQSKCRIPLQPFLESEIAAAFDQDTGTDHPVEQVLLLLFVLTFNRAVRTRVRRLLQYPEPLAPPTPPPYSEALLDQIPIKRLLLTAESNPIFADVFPMMLSLVIEFYPELLDGQALAASEQARTERSQNEHLYDAGALNTAAIDCVVSPAEALVALRCVSLLPAAELEQHADALLDRVLPQLLSPTVERRVLETFHKIWDRMNEIIPRRLWLRTLQGLPPAQGWEQELTQQSLVADPLLVLRCNAQVFKRPTLFKIVLTILKGYMDASANKLAERCATARAGTDSEPSTASMPSSGPRYSPADLDSFLSTLVMTQNSAIVQMLFEACSADINAEEPGVLQEIQIAVCAFVHQLFIQNPLLLKLVHFQGYDARLIDVFVLGIPSMHICIDFIPEMLVQPALDKQIFAIQLAGHLSSRYSIPKMLAAARRVLGKMHDLAHSDTTRISEFFRPTRQSLVLMCSAFPMLAQSVIELLLKLQSIHRAALATGAGVICFDSEDDLAKLIAGTFDDVTAVLLPRTLNV